MENIKPDWIWITILVVLAVCGSIKVIGDAVATIKKWRSPTEDIHSMLANDKRRIEALEESVQQLRDSVTQAATDHLRLAKHDDDIADLQKGVEQLVIGVKELIRHELYDGNEDEMKGVLTEIDRYLIQRGR